MQDPRIDTLARTLLDHSCQVKAGDKILVEAFDLPDPALVCALVEGAAARKAIPVVSWKSNTILRSLYRTGTPESLGLCGELERHQMEQMDCYIGIRGAANSNGFADVPGPCPQHPLGRAPLPHGLDGSIGSHEHRRI